jgi:transcriptional regulator with PAS, ATPase and Fis domain
MKILIAWIGQNDIDASNLSEKSDNLNLGPIGSAIKARPFEKVYLLSNYSSEKIKGVESLLQRLSSGPLQVVTETVSLTSPTNFPEIWNAANYLVQRLAECDELKYATVHLSPGTNTMSSVWVLLASSHNLPAIKTSRESGLEDETLPIEIYTNYVGDLVKGRSQILREALSSAVNKTSKFDDITYQSTEMHNAIQRAKTIAPYDISVLIEGPTGTGKELFATAIQKASSRADKKFRVINCGAIPETLIDAELFGYMKGAFTGATEDTKGEFEKADGGTIFLDEVGELSPQAQVRLLRVLQEKKVRRIGSSEGEISIDIRIISATNRDLREEIANGKFREDLYYRLSATTIAIPSLKARRGDLQLLADAFVEQKSKELRRESITITASGRRALSKHTWPGNVRELELTIARAIIFSSSGILDQLTIEEAIGKNITPAQNKSSASIEFTEDFNLTTEVSRYKKQLMDAALAETSQRKNAAAKLLGMTPPNFSSQYKKLTKS